MTGLRRSVFSRLSRGSGFRGCVGISCKTGGYSVPDPARPQQARDGGTSKRMVRHRPARTSGFHGLGDPAELAYVDLSTTKVGSPAVRAVRRWLCGERAAVRPDSGSVGDGSLEDADVAEWESGGGHLSPPWGFGERPKKELLVSYGFAVIHRGVGYSFTYVCPAAKLRRYLPSFERLRVRSASQPDVERAAWCNRPGGRREVADACRGVADATGTV